MRKDFGLVWLTVAVVLAVLGVGVVSGIMAQPGEAAGRDGGWLAVVFEAGYVLEELEGGGVRISGRGRLVEGGEGPTRPDSVGEVGPVYVYPYPVPDQVYPDPGGGWCEVQWMYGQVCP